MDDLPESVYGENVYCILRQRIREGRELPAQAENLLQDIEDHADIVYRLELRGKPGFIVGCAAYISQKEIVLARLDVEAQKNLFVEAMKSSEAEFKNKSPAAIDSISSRGWPFVDEQFIKNAKKSKHFSLDDPRTLSYSFNYDWRPAWSYILDGRMDLDAIPHFFPYIDLPRTSATSLGMLGIRIGNPHDEERTISGKILGNLWNVYDRYELYARKEAPQPKSLNTPFATL